MTTTTDARARPDRTVTAWRVPLVVVVTGLSGGVLTSLGQQYLPDQLHSLANSSTSWSVVAFALAWTTRRWWAAVLTAVAAFVLLLAGYEIASQLRLGFGMAPATWVMWSVLGVVAGPVLGLAAWRGRRDPGRGRCVAVGLLAGLAVGEGIYGLTVVGETTSPVYWWLSIAVGVVALAAHAAWFRSAHLTALAILVTAGVAGGFLTLYGAGLPV